MEAKIIELISEHFGIPVSEIDPQMELKKDLNATDLEIADLFQMIEHEFKLTISHEDLVEIQTVSDLISYINDHAEEVN